MDDDRDDITLPLILVGAGVGLLAAVALYGNRRVRMALAEAGVEARRRDRELREEFDVPSLAEGLEHLRRLQTNLVERVQRRPGGDEVAHAFRNF